MSTKIDDSKYARWQESAIKKAISHRRVVILAGARQCGKTTLAKSLGLQGTIYRTLDDVTLLESARSDPHGFVYHGDELMIIDEVQRAPVLLQAIKKDVDENHGVGRFLLTGSANIQSLPGVNESLAGRATKIRLRALSQGELNGVQPNFLPQAFEEKFKAIASNDNKDRYIELAFQGGYPEPLRLQSTHEKKQWYRDYTDLLIERDLKDILNIKRRNSMKELLVVLGSRSGKLIDFSNIASNLTISRQTVTAYVNALESLYLVERLSAWPKTDYDRVNRHDKLFMSDTGLMTSILNWQYPKVKLDGDLNGKLLETFVFIELSSHIEALRQSCDYNIYHYRDRDKREIDFLIEHQDGRVLGIEVKSGSSVTRSDFKHLKWFKSHMSIPGNFIGIVLYTGEQVSSFGDSMWAVPINRLWS